MAQPLIAIASIVTLPKLVQFRERRINILVLSPAPASGSAALKAISDIR
jgi:hypothetical protein